MMIGKHNAITKGLISMHNVNKLTDVEISKRRADYLTIPKERGYLISLASKWNVSHTQVKRWIEKYENGGYVTYYVDTFDSDAEKVVYLKGIIKYMDCLLQSLVKRLEKVEVSKLVDVEDLK